MTPHVERGSHYLTNLHIPGLWIGIDQRKYFAGPFGDHMANDLRLRSSVICRD